MNEATIAARLYGPSPEPVASHPMPDDDTAARLFGASQQPQQAAGARDPAARLFGGPDADPEPVAAEEREPITDDELLARLYPEEPEPVELDPVPADVQALRDAQDRRTFSAQTTYRDAAPDGDFEALGIDPEVGRKGMAEVREIFADLDLTPGDVRGLRERAERLRDAPVDPIAQREAAVDALNREFGKGAAQAWREARALVARDPRVSKIIETMGLGDDAATIVRLAHVARAQRLSGKLKGVK